MDRARTKTDAAGQSQKLQQMRAESASGSGSSASSGSRSDSGSSDSERDQQSTPPGQPQPTEQQQQSQQHHQHPTQQKSQKPHNPPQQPHKSTSSTGASHARPKSQKHVVGGGGSTARLHARVPSSKALHKTVHHHHVSSASSSKLQQHQQQHQQQLHHRRRSSASPPPSDYAGRFPFAAVPPPIEQTHQQRPQLSHRRSTSTNEAKLQSNANSSSASSLVRRNASATSLKRNRSHADVAKRMSQGHSRPTALLKRTNSNPAVSRDRLRPLSSSVKKPNSQVHFEIGSPDAQDDEWVDAGSSNLSGSRKNSLPYREEDNREAKDEQEEESEEEEEEELDTRDQHQIRGQPRQEDRLEAKQKEVELPIRTTNSNSPQPPFHRIERSESAELRRPSSSASTSTTHVRTGSTNRLLLPRTPPRGAPPKMSNETASATHNMHSSSPDSSPTRRLQHRQQQSLPGGSNDRDAMTSRFITTGSHESASATTGGGSFYTTSSSRPSTGRHPIDDRDATSSTNGGSASANAAGLSHPRRARSIGGEPSLLTDDEDSGVIIGGEVRKSGAAGGTHPRRTRLPHAPPAELSRTQQKLNLERASSSIDRSSRQHQGPAAGPLLGAGEFGIHDPRIGKLMEKTGMEYYVVHRYQNPVTRSLSRLTDRLGGDKNWRIPAANGGSRTPTGLSTDTNGPAAGHGATRSAASGLSQSFRERDIRRDVLQSAAAAAAAGTGAIANAPAGPSRSKTFTTNTSSGAAGEPTTAYQQQQRLSGASLVDGYDEDSTAALLRNLWDKNLYLGTSQD